MAKNSNDNTRKGTNSTPQGIMPPDMVQRHKLTINNTPSEVGYKIRGKKLKQMIETVKEYRLTAHGSLEKKLPRSLLNGINYMLTPITKDHNSSATG